METGPNHETRNDFQNAHKNKNKLKLTTHGTVGYEIINYFYWIINDASN